MQEVKFNIGEKVVIVWTMASLKDGIGQVVDIKRSYPGNDFYYNIRFKSFEIWCNDYEIRSLKDYRKDKLREIEKNI